MKITFNIKGIQSIFWLVTILCTLTVASHAQNDPIPTLNIGDVAPPMRLREWIKGDPVRRFEKGMVYIIEFWATWCRPCKAAMPHLSTLSDKYKDSVTVLGINILESKNTPTEKIKKFVDSMGQNMNYRVAVQDSNFMEIDWFLAAGGGKYLGIPTTFVINKEGRIAWIGHPKDLENNLSKILNNTWDIKGALNKRNLTQRLKELDDSLNNVLYKYRDDDRIKPVKKGQPVSALLAIDKIIRTEPKLKYTTFIVYNTFVSLLKTNQQEALEYGKCVLITPSYDDEPAYDMIIGAIETYSNKLTLSAKIFQLGAEACKTRIDYIPYPEIVDMHKHYHKMASWYWLAKNRLKAIEAEQEAIFALKSKIDFSKIKLTEYELALQKYSTGINQ